MKFGYLCVICCVARVSFSQGVLPWQVVADARQSSAAEFAASNGVWHVRNVVRESAAFDYGRRCSLLQRVTGDFLLEARIDAACLSGKNNNNLQIGLILTASAAAEAAPSLVFGLANDFTVHYLESLTPEQPEVLRIEAPAYPGLAHRLMLRRENGRVYASVVGGDKGEVSLDFFDAPVGFGEELYAGIVVFQNGLAGSYAYAVRDLALSSLEEGRREKPAPAAALPAVWRAGSLAVNDRMPVAAWPSGDQRFLAQLSRNAKARTPTFSKADTGGGYPSVHFNGIDQMLVISGPNPLDNSASYTIACVFSCERPMVSQGDQFPRDALLGSSYLISSHFTGNSSLWNDFTIGIGADGRVVAGLGMGRNKVVHQTIESFRVDDGTPHVVIFSLDDEQRVFRLNVDGVSVESPPFLWRRLFAYPISMGGHYACHAGRFLNGKIFEVVFFDRRCLTADEMNAVGHNLAGRYGVKRVSYRLPAQLPDDIRSVMYDGVPLIVTQPQDCQASSGQEVFFSVEVADAPGTRYQWFEDGAAVPGLITPRICIHTGSGKFFSKKYSCSVSNDSGRVFTREAALESIHGK